MSKQVLIIGSGLFGSVIRDALVRDGHEVAIIDDERPHNGSKPSASLMKPSWFSSLGKDVYDPALELLDDLYGVQELQFKVGPVKMDGVLWTPPNKICRGHNITGTVQAVRKDHVAFTEVMPDGLSTMDFDICIVAAGVWSDQLVDVPGLKGQAGVAFTWTTPKCFEMEPFIKPWAPYKQTVGFMRGERELWVGDGSSILTKNWTDEREEQCLARCHKAAGIDGEPTERIFGIRPQIKGIKHAYLKQITPKVWVATGGAKNGTLGAAWAANELRAALC